MVLWNNKRSTKYHEPSHQHKRPSHRRTVEWERVEFKSRWKDMREFRFLSRRYRNRRVGKFLKELEMTEGRGTGIPKMLREIKKNGSPEPIFHTDDDRTFFLVEFPIHPVFAEALKKNDSTEVTTEVAPEVKRVLMESGQAFQQKTRKSKK